MLVFFAAEAPLASEKIFSLGPLPFTNSMLFGLLTAAFVLGIFGMAARASQLWPKSRLAYYSELLVDAILGFMVDTFGDYKRAMRHFPLLISLFVFILASNLSGLLPGVGTITVNVDGSQVPLLRAFTTDLNSTLALAAFSLATVYIYAFKELGVFGMLRHYFTAQPWKPMNLFMGVNEVFGEVLRLVTLSLRLFGVIYGGEALLHAISNLAGNFGWAATLPIMFLEIFFSLVQAYLFMMLTATYLVMAVPLEEHSGSSAKEAAPAGS